MSGLRLSRDLAVIPIGSTTPRNGRYVLTVPGMDAPLYTLDLPQGVTGPSRLRIAVEQMSDRLGIPSDQFLLFPADSDKLWGRAVVCDADFQRVWAADPTATASGCSSVLPDYMTLPAAAESVVVSQNGDTMMARIGLSDGFSCPLSLAPIILSRGLADIDIKTAIVSGDIPPTLSTILTNAGLAISGSETATAFAAGELAIDLRKGGNSGTRQRQTTIGISLAAAGIAALAFGLWTASVLIETGRIERSTEQFRENTVLILREGLIPTGPILDIKQQAIRALTLASGANTSEIEGTPMAVLSHATVAIFGKGIQMRSLSFTPDTGLILGIVASDFASVETLTEDLRSDGLRAVAGSLRTRESGGVEAQITITEVLP